MLVPSSGVRRTRLPGRHNPGLLRSTDRWTDRRWRRRCRRVARQHPSPRPPAGSPKPVGVRRACGCARLALPTRRGAGDGRRSPRATRRRRDSPWQTVAITGGTQAASGPSEIMDSRSATVRAASARSALLTTRTSATSKNPALLAWTVSPHPAGTTTTVVSAVVAISTSDWPTPTVSITISEKPRPSRAATTDGVVSEIPPSEPRFATERMKTRSSPA